MGRTTPKPDAALKKGSAEMLVLSLLEERARHGYEIAKLIEQRSNGVLTFHAASLYPLLYRMEARRLIQGRWVEKAGQRRKRHYSITAAGKRVLAERRSGWNTFIDALVARRGVESCVTGTPSFASTSGPARSFRIQAIEELAQHVEETWRAARAAGRSDEDALAAAQAPAGKPARRGCPRTWLRPPTVTRADRLFSSTASGATSATPCACSARGPASPPSR